MVNFEALNGSENGEAEKIDSSIIDIEEEVKLTSEAIDQVITMASQLRDELLDGDFVKKLKEAQQNGEAGTVETLKSEALDKLEGVINFIEMIGGDDGLGKIKKKLELTKEYIMQKF